MSHIHVIAVILLHKRTAFYCSIFRGTNKNGVHQDPRIVYPAHVCLRAGTSQLIRCDYHTQSSQTRNVLINSSLRTCVVLVPYRLDLTHVFASKTCWVAHIHTHSIYIFLLAEFNPYTEQRFFETK